MTDDGHLHTSDLHNHMDGGFLSEYKDQAKY